MNRLERTLILTAVVGVASVAGSLRVLRAFQVAVEHIEISAPILPSTKVLYPHEGANLPTSLEERATIAHDAALTYDFLLHACVDKYPAIVIPGPGAPATTDEQNATNFENVAQCSYEQYGAKPYWIPALIDTVDICGRELGAGWRLPTEEDVASLGAEERTRLASALATPHAGSSWGAFYFGLGVWVRGTNGALRLGDLSPAANPTVDVPSSNPAIHFESGVSLRCIRRTTIPAGSGSGGAGGAAATAGAGGAGGAGGAAGMGGA